MNRLLVPPSKIEFPSIVVCDEELAYLRDVLRLRPGAPLEVFDGQGRAWASMLVEYVADGARIELGDETVRAFEGVSVTLWQGLPKSDRLDLVLQKSVELGVRGVRPVVCERSVVRLDAKKAAARLERWRKIANEAARQSLRADVADVEPVVSFAEAMQLPPAPNERRLLLDEEERSVRLRDALGTANDTYVVLVGPEGGFTRAEVEEARKAGFTPVTLGPRVLRTETAGIAVLAVMQHVLGDFG